MKKILIISYYYAPENKIGALRPTKISKYLSGSGVCVDVVTKKYKYESDSTSYERDTAGVNKIIRISHSKQFTKFFNENVEAPPRTDIIQLSSKKTRPFLNKKHTPRFLKNIYRQLLDTYKSIDFYLQTKKYVLKNYKDFEEYDSVLTTYGPISNHMCGNFLKSRFNVNWICDFRDPMTNQLNSFIVNKIYSLIQRKFCNKADYITTVSRGYLTRIVRGKNINKSLVIPNGFDIEDKPSNTSSSEFSFSYVGALYEGKRKIVPLFKAIRSLIDEGVLVKEDFIFNYAGNDFIFLHEQAKQFNLQNNLFNKGTLSRNECMELQSMSRFLVLSTWNNEGELGVFPGKFLEYMLIEKPIISIVDGNLPNSEVTEVMNEIKLGVSYEETHMDEHLATLKNYLEVEYSRYKKGLRANLNPNKDVLERYNYIHIAKQFGQLL